MSTKSCAFTVMAVLAVLLGTPDGLSARPTFPTTFNALYGTAGTPLGSCRVCHTRAPALNRYGTAVRTRLLTGLTLRQALRAIQRLDSDRDTFTNIVEIRALTFPGNAKSFPVAVAALPASVQAKATAVNTSAQNEYAFLAFDQVDPSNYRYVRVMADQVVLGQTAGYTDDDGEPMGGMETAIPLDAWSTVQVEVLDTGTVKIYLDGASEPFASYDF